MHLFTKFNVGDRVYLVNLGLKTITRNTVTIVRTRHDKEGTDIEYVVDGTWVGEKPGANFALFRSKTNAKTFLKEKLGDFLTVQTTRLQDQINFHKERLEAAELSLKQLLTN